MKSLTVFNPQSPEAHGIFQLAIIVGIILAGIFAIVAGMVVYALMRYRWREGETDPDQIAGNKTVEIVWTAIPFLIVVALFLFTWKTMAVVDPPPPSTPDVVVTGHQWWWEARYPKSGVITANEIHIPTGKPLSVRLESADVLHEFWVPQLTRKMTTLPEHPNHIWIQADDPSTYLGFCSEFCGTQHAWMHFLIVAEKPQQFEAWENAQLAAASAPAAGSVAQGVALYQQMSCMNCHAINGTASTARVGPDLTHLASRRILGGGVVENTPTNLRRWLTDPQKVKPGVKMPGYKFTEDQVTQLTDYLETLR